MNNNNGSISFGDIIKNIFTDSFAELSWGTIIITLLFAFAVGLLIYFTYLKCYKGVIYSQSFNASLVLMCVITATVIMVISSNVVLSLGMVGALSIVRFRAAIKDPMDIVFLFWSIAMGIIIGARQYMFGVIAAVVAAVAFFIMLKLRGRREIYLFIVRFENAVQPEVGRVLSKIDGKVRNKSLSGGITELTIELVLHNNNTSFVDRMAQIDGVHSAVLVNYNGDFTE